MFSECERPFLLAPNISPLAGGEYALKFDYTLERVFSLNSKIVSSWKKLFRSGPQ